MKFLSLASRSSLQQFLDEVFKSVSDGNISLLDILRVAYKLWLFVKTLTWDTIEFEKFEYSFVDIAARQADYWDSDAKPAGKTAGEQSAKQADPPLSVTGSTPPVSTGR